MRREEALSKLAELDGEELAQDFYAFARRRAAILHASSAWGFCSDGAIIQRLLDEVEAQNGAKLPKSAPHSPQTSKTTPP